MPSLSRGSAPLFAVFFAAFAVSCTPAPSAIAYPAADLRPPGLLAAGPTSSSEVLLRFDEEVRPVAGSFAADPSASLAARAEAESLFVAFAEPQSAGTDYAMVGEAEDLRGNRTRFLLRFTGWNDRAPPLLLSEVLPCKNSSKTKPHRDFIELLALGDGNLGGEELSWASTVKAESYRFPSAEVKKGDFIVLHLAPEGIPAERDETGAELSASGGVDATATGRDFWCGSMPLSDSSGAIAVALRPGSPPTDGLFYSDDGKSGALGEGKLADLLASLVASGAWALSGSSPAWEDGVPWSGSSAKSLCRSGSGKGLGAWYVSVSGGQTPGAGNSPPGAPSAATMPSAAAKAMQATDESPSAGASDLSAAKAEKPLKAAKPGKKKPVRRKPGTD
jgi:hypothetical protein